MICEPIFGESLHLHCLEDHHASDAYLSWMEDPEVNQYLESRHRPHTADDLQNYIRDIRDSPHSYLFGIFTPDGVQRGNLKIGPISYEHRSAAIGIILGDKTVWGQGIASQTIGLLTTLTFDELRLEKLWSGAYSVNLGSIRAFERNDYVIKGVQRLHVPLASRGVQFSPCLEKSAGD